MKTRHIARHSWQTLILFSMALLTMPPGVFAQERAQDLFQQALRMEQVGGDLEGAISLYQQVVDTGDRVLGARALIRIAESYEKLGRGGAQAAYARIIEEFRDQTELVTLARERLAALDAPRPTAPASRLAPENLTTRLVWEGPAANVFSQLTPDGRYLITSDSRTGWNLALKDLQTEETRKLTTNANDLQWAEAGPVSRDGSWVAYEWHQEAGPTQLRIVGMDGSSPRVLIENGDSQIDGFRPSEWTRDGDAILTQLNLASGRGTQWALVSVEDGSREVVRGFTRGFTQGRPFLSPDGRWIAHSLGGGLDNPSNVHVEHTDGGGDRVLVDHPAQDRSPIFSPDGRYLLFASNRRGSMDLWALPFRDGSADGEPFLVKGDVGDFWPMGFAADGSLFYDVRSRGTNIYTADFDLATNTIQGEPDQVVQHFEGYNTDPDWSRDGRVVVYSSKRYHRFGTFQTQARNEQLIVLDLETGEEKVPGAILFPGYYPAARTRVSPDGNMVLIERAQAPKLGWGLALLDVESGEFDLLRPNRDSAQAGGGEWSRDGEHIIYLSLQHGGEVPLYELVRRQVVSGSEEVVHRFESRPVERLWALSHDGNRLVYGVRDGGNLRVVDLTTGEGQEIYVAEVQGHISVRAGVLTWTPDGENILFAVDLGDQGEGPELREVMSIPAGGGEARSTGLVMEELRHLTFLPDGQRIGFSAGPSETTQIWVMENLFSGNGGEGR